MKNVSFSSTKRFIADYILIYKFVEELLIHIKSCESDSSIEK